MLCVCVTLHIEPQIAPAPLESRIVYFGVDSCRQPLNDLGQFSFNVVVLSLFFFSLTLIKLPQVIATSTGTPSEWETFGDLYKWVVESVLELVSSSDRDVMRCFSWSR